MDLQSAVFLPVLSDLRPICEHPNLSCSWALATYCVKRIPKAIADYMRTLGHCQDTGKNLEIMGGGRKTSWGLIMLGTYAEYSNSSHISIESDKQPLSADFDKLLQ